jgi:hypothetical protein
MARKASSQADSSTCDLRSGSESPDGCREAKLVTGRRDSGSRFRVSAHFRNPSVEDCLIVIALPLQSLAKNTLGPYRQCSDKRDPGVIGEAGPEHCRYGMFQ